MKKLLISFLLFSLYSISSFAQNSSAVPIKITWDYKGVPSPLQIYELSPKSQAKLWDTDTKAKLNLTPVGKIISNSELLLKPGEKKTFVLLLKNNTKQKVHFFAAPHVANPPEYSLGFKFKCLCINHVYAVAAGDYWYRVVELQLFPDYAGKGFEIKHSLIKVDEKQANTEMGHEHDHGD